MILEKKIEYVHRILYFVGKLRIIHLCALNLETVANMGLTNRSAKAQIIFKMAESIFIH